MAKNKKQSGGDIKGPVGFLKSYYESEKFKERLKKAGNRTIDPKELVKNINKYKTYILPENYKEIIGNNNTIGSRAIASNFDKADFGIEIPKGTNVILDPTEGSEPSMSKLLNEIYPHELTHLSQRELSPSEEKNIYSRNRLSQDPLFNKRLDFTLYDKYLKSSKKYSSPLASKDYYSFSDYIINNNELYEKNHDLVPQENYSNLNAVRYLLFKEGINDPRKQDFTEDDLKKARENKTINYALPFSTLEKAFSDEDLIWMLNNIAKTNTNKSTVAKNGGTIDMKSKLGYSKASPYIGNPYIDINTSNGLIDMSKTPFDLLGITANGEQQIMKAGDKNPYKFNSSLVREIPLKQGGGLTQGEIMDFLFDEDDEDVSPPTTQDIENLDYLNENKKRLYRSEELNNTLNAENEEQIAELNAFLDEEQYTSKLRNGEDDQQLYPNYLTSNPKNSPSPEYSTPNNPYTGEIFSSGKSGTSKIGNMGRQIYGDIANALGYAPVANSIYRSPEHQNSLIAQGLPAAKNSKHLSGNAVDIKPSDWQKLSKAQQNNLHNKYKVIYHNNHYHLEPK